MVVESSTSYGLVERVGVIGLGKMGMPIARNLIARGFQVVGYRRRRCADLLAAGGHNADSPAAIAEDCDVVLSVLPSANDVYSVLRGVAGILTAVRPGLIHIEMSTIDIADKLKMAEELRSLNADMLDCPISGGPDMVASHRATTFVSGQLESVERVRPVLDAIGGRWMYAGEFGCGTRLKYVANLLLAIHNVAAAEAIVFARRSGLDLNLVQEALDNSIASSAVLKERGPRMRSREWSPAAGSVATLHHILEQIERSARTLEVSHPVFDAARKVYRQALSQGYADSDIACVHDLLLPHNENQLAATSPTEQTCTGRIAERRLPPQNSP
ncbi:NAD(P)-dependent oxidoreductase [uncultured Mycobacterium sp.]|uniref:NAD(P)-dependent oxidoreductase n=1 Tax=uncultured Mycobacterium sp. TaxID=171292 RepID=UPI0035C94A4A